MAKIKGKLRVAVSPLTNTIFAGTTLKDGVWASGKQDVTMDTLISVAEHVKTFGKPVKITDKKGKLIYTITVK